MKGQLKILNSLLKVSPLSGTCIHLVLMQTAFKVIWFYNGMSGSRWDCYTDMNYFILPGSRRRCTFLIFLFILFKLNNLKDTCLVLNLSCFNIIFICFICLIFYISHSLSSFRLFKHILSFLFSSFSIYWFFSYICFYYSLSGYLKNCHIYFTTF